jgi:hypothetical protein
LLVGVFSKTFLSLISQRKLKFPKYRQKVPEISPKSSRNIDQKFPKYRPKVPEISTKSSRNIDQKFPKYLTKVPEISPTLNQRFSTFRRLRNRIEILKTKQPRLAKHRNLKSGKSKNKVKWWKRAQDVSANCHIINWIFPPKYSMAQYSIYFGIVLERSYLERFPPIFFPWFNSTSSF